MGVNNRQRRRAKQRKRQRRRSGGSPPGGFTGWTDETTFADHETAYELASVRVAATVHRMGTRRVDQSGLRARAEALVRELHPVPHHVVASVLGDLLARLVDDIVRGGWGPTDLAELVARCAGRRHLPMLSSLLHEEARRSKRNGKAWLTAIDAIDLPAEPDPTVRLDTMDRLGSGLRLAALLIRTPVLTADEVAGAASPRSGPLSRTAEHPKLTQVRALLAKAESTEYNDEAEALSAKAQELISRYALDRLVAAAEGSRPDGDAPQARRFWLDAPYVRAKATLVHEVASANRCKAASADAFGFCLVVGSAADLDAVELLTTSLLVQADAAMLRHGRRYDAHGVRRTRSFRQAFLTAYAVRIGERLREAAEETAANEGGGRWLPVLRDQEAKVSEAFDTLVPHTVGKATSVSNGEGWHAGLAAADLAQLDVHGRLRDAG